MDIRQPRERLDWSAQQKRWAGERYGAGQHARREEQEEEHPGVAVCALHDRHEPEAVEKLATHRGRRHACM